jgi:large subunit ribosomal protein L25
VVSLVAGEPILDVKPGEISMSNTAFELEVAPRQDKGKGASRRLRHDNKVPAIVYGEGKEPLNIMLAHHKLMKALENPAFASSVITLKMGDKTETAVVKALQRHPAERRILHADFLRVSATAQITMRVPLEFVGADVAPGIKAGGVATHAINDIEIRCSAQDLPEKIVVDITEMELDTALHLSDLKLPKGVEIPNFDPTDHEHDLPVLSIHVPKEVVEEEPEAVEGEQAAEGEAAEGGEEKSEGGEGEADAS